MQIESASDTGEEMHEINQVKRLAQGVANEALPLSVGNGPFVRVSLGFSPECPTAWETPQSWAIQDGWPPGHKPKGRKTGVKYRICWSPDSAEGVHDSCFNQEASSYSSP